MESRFFIFSEGIREIIRMFAQEPTHHVSAGKAKKKGGRSAETDFSAASKVDVIANSTKIRLRRGSSGSIYGLTSLGQSYRRESYE
jgi:hypothetical protein